MKLFFKGFSLLELIVAVAIFLIVISGLLITFVYCIILNESNNNLVKAVNDAQYVLEQIKALAYDQIVTYTCPTFNNLNDENIALDPPPSIGTQIAEVTVNVSWTERQRARSFQLSTRIARSH